MSDKEVMFRAIIKSVFSFSLSAMSSSKNDVVAQSVCSSVRQLVMKEFHGRVETISNGFQETFEGVSGVFLMVFEASSKVVCQTSF